MVLDMAGNVGTQSLAVTIRVLMDENLTPARRSWLLLGKEMRVGLVNGGLPGPSWRWRFLGRLHPFLQGAMRGGRRSCSPAALGVVARGGHGASPALWAPMVPMLFHKIHIDPAVASGPLITTVNDLVAVVVYYGLAMIVLIEMFHLG